MCYPGHTGDGIMAVLVWGALQVSVIRIPRKGLSSSPGTGTNKACLCFPVTRQSSWGEAGGREGGAIHPGPTTWEQQALPSWWTRAYSPQQVEVCARRAYLWPLAAWYLRREGGSWVWRSHLTSEEILTHGASSAEFISLPSLHH